VAEAYDAVVVGSGPNGLAAAITLASRGLSVLVREAQPTLGGGLRSAALTEPGFVHDLGAAVQALLPLSPFVSSLPLAEHGLRLAYPAIPWSQPLDGGRAALGHRDVGQTAAGLGVDGPAYQQLMGPLVRDVQRILPAVLGPARPPRHPVAMARFALAGLRSASGLAEARFREEPARALLGGLAAHSVLPLGTPPTAAVGLVLALTAHAGGWPVAVGGSQSVAQAMASYLRALGGQVQTGAPVTDLDELPPARAVLLDVAPRQLLALAGNRFPPSYRRALRRFRHGPGAFKLDYALDRPVPWADPDTRRAGTIHLGGTLAEMRTAEDEVLAGRHPDRPYVLVVQPSIVDPTRAPAGKSTLWAYTHVPNGSTVDMTAAVEAQLERFAPGFRDVVRMRVVSGPAELERQNANLVGGDITGGTSDLRQLFTRPAVRVDPYSTPDRRLYLCSSSTPPGAGVHGMCGYFAARSALRRVFG